VVQKTQQHLAVRSATLSERDDRLVEQRESALGQCLLDTRHPLHLPVTFSQFVVIGLI
jgi:hypothetical protein